MYKNVTGIIVIEKNPSLARLAFTHNDFSSVIKHPGVSFHIGVDPDKLEVILNNDRTNLAIHGYTTIDFKPLIQLETSYYTLIKKEINNGMCKYCAKFDGSVK